MERAQGDMLVVSLERTVIPDHARFQAILRVCVWPNDEESLRGFSKRGIGLDFHLEKNHTGYTQRGR